MADQLTAEQRLNIALEFLTKQNQGSYLYPKVIELTKHLTNKGISENEHLPIILHLVRGKYVDAFYSDKDDERKGEFPHQIKVTFKGIKFQEKGGYVNLLKEEKHERNRFWIPVLISIISVLFAGLNTWFNFETRQKNHDLELRIQKLESQGTITSEKQ